MAFQSRFGKAADAYCTYRPEYPPTLYERILAALPPNQRERAMDLGAGTGKSTHALMEHFAEVIAVEPDPLMAEKLRQAEPRAIVQIATAEECGQEPASVDAILIATALHWMDVPRVIANVERWLRPRGVLAVCGGGLPRMPDPVWTVVRREFVERWENYRDLRLKRREFPESILEAARELRIAEETALSHIVPLTAREFAGFWRSTSYGSAYARTLGDEESYWHALEEDLRAAWPEEKIPIDFKLWLFVLRRE
jgi:trans-aconitate methyltransferase